VALLVRRSTHVCRLGPYCSIASVMLLYLRGFVPVFVDKTSGWGSGLTELCAWTLAKLTEYVPVRSHSVMVVLGSIENREKHNG